MEKQEANYAEMSHTFIDKFNKDEEVDVKLRFKKPTVSAASKAQSKMMKNPGQALHNLCVECVHPDDKHSLVAVFKEYPGLATTFGGSILTSSGFGELGN